MLRKHFPVNDVEAKAYGGFMRDNQTFCHLFHLENNYSQTIDNINKFLFDSGYSKVSIEDFDEEWGYENQYLSISKHGYKDKLVLFIYSPTSIVSLEDALKKLTTFRDERDWEQFHNSKDLSLAISIEASELLELFLSKGEEDFDREKLENELADVMSYCLLLAAKNGLNIPRIIIKKIEQNALKYPVEKAKGSSRKYNNL